MGRHGQYGQLASSTRRCDDAVAEHKSWLRMMDVERGAAENLLMTAASERANPCHLRRRLIASDVVAVTLGFTVATVLQQLLKPVQASTLREEILLALVFVPMWVLTMGTNHLFRARAVDRFGEELRRLLVSGVITVGLLVAVSFVAQYSDLSRLWVGLLFVCVTASLVTSRLVARHVFNDLRLTGRLSRPVIVVGMGSDVISLLHATQRRPDLGYEVLGFTGDRVDEGDGLLVLGSVDETLDVVRATGATGVILSVGSLDPAVVNRLTRTLTYEGCHVTLSSSLHDIKTLRELGRRRSTGG